MKVLGAHSEIVMGNPSRVSGSPSRTDWRQMYWPSPSFSLVICLTASRWKIQRARGQYWPLRVNLASISPSKPIAVVVLPVATSRFVEMPFGGRAGARRRSR